VTHDLDASLTASAPAVRGARASGAPDDDAGPVADAAVGGSRNDANVMPTDAAVTTLDAGSPALQAPTPIVRKLNTTWIGQLTGRQPNPLASLGMTGTDLGVSFQLDDDIVFLFGDSLGTSTSEDITLDSLARTPAAVKPSSAPKLAWYTRPGGKFLPLNVASIDLHGMNVPVEGLKIGDTTYLFFTSGWSDTTSAHRTSVLAHARDEAFGQLTLDHAAMSGKFLNLSIVREGKQLWIWGSGEYRRSSVYLARATVDTFTDRSSWTYYQGMRGAEPQLGPDEQSATPVVQADCVGEFSVRRHEALGVYMMTYNCGGPPRGIVLRTSSTPAGPWSEPILIYEPSDGYEHFMHAQQSAAGHDDGLSDDGAENTWGGEYGPYLIPAWFSEPATGVHEIVYTLSSWNPYQVQLLKTVLAEPGADAPIPTPGADLPRAGLQNASFEGGSLTGWTATGDGFRTFQDEGGTWAVTTFTDRQDAAVGELSQQFAIDASTSTLSFELHGGHGAVSLYVGDARVRHSRARDSNDVRVPVVWRLETLRGKTVRLAIEDQVTDGWGFISVSGFRLQ
jgi:hypothetical protein